MRAIRIRAGEEVECSDEELRAEGILCERFDTGAARSIVQRIQAERGWPELDDVRRSALKPQDEAEIAKEADEHCHLDDEVRLFLEGQGLYDIRAQDEDWLRVWVQPGDLIAVPAKRYHRFLVGHATSLRYLQPYASRSVLLQLYRVSGDQTRAG